MKRNCKNCVPCIPHVVHLTLSLQGVSWWKTTVNREMPNNPVIPWDSVSMHSEIPNAGRCYPESKTCKHFPGSMPTCMWNLQRHQTRLSLLVNLTATYRLLGRERGGGVASFEHQMQTETVSRLILFTSWSRTQPACIHFPTFLRKYSQWSILFD